MKVNVKMNRTALTILAQAQIIAISQTAERMISETIQEQVIPFDEGTLQNVSTRVDERNIKKGTVKIVHDILYAARLYFHPEYNFNQSKNANAKGAWWDDWLTGIKAEKPSELFKRYFRKAAIKYVKPKRRFSR